MMVFAEEAGVVRRQGVDRPAAFLGIATDMRDIVRKAGQPACPHPRGNAAIDQLRLAIGQQDADLFIHQRRDGTVVARVEFELPRAAVGEGGSPVHAASAALGRLAKRPRVVSASTSAISATRPSPRIVAPATPSIAW